MKKTLLFLITILVCSGGFAQSLWNKTEDGRIQNLEKMDRLAMPFKYSLYHLDLQELKEQLSIAPRRLTGAVSNVVISFPVSNGAYEDFVVYNAPVVEDGLAEKFSGLDSYVGQSLKNPATGIRFSVTQFGLHAMIFASEGVSYIDTYTKNLENYILYKKADLYENRSFECSVDSFGEGEMTGMPSGSFDVGTPAMDDGNFRTYRLAMACTIEYADYHVNAAGVESGTLDEKKAAVLAAMVVTMTRVDGIYEKDMSLTMVLISNNEDIIFIDNDLFSNNSSSSLIAESQSVINSTIGAANYDIGHTVSTGGGGLASLGVVCVNNFKARGITGSPAPIGDAYDIDYVAHEMGHQFGANHTFRGTGGACSGNVNNSTAVEPGSGSTIMAYAGICSNNVQSNSDDYFHAVSIAEMKNVVLFSATCAVTVANGNSAPAISAGADYIIPKSTPYVLEAVGTDADGDALTYCWEQLDHESSTQPPVETAVGGPNYRSFDPAESSKRYMPKLESVLNNTLSTTWEVTPSVGRSMNFSCTVRDNQLVNGGQTNRDNMIVTVNALTGPFDVTSQSAEGISWSQGETQTITWTVNSTNTLAGSANVDILLSIDSGLTYPITLAANTPNDGTQDITVPDIAAPFCRVMVKPTGNIFYDVNTTDFAIGYTVTNTCYTYSNTTPLVIPDGNGTNGTGPVAGQVVANTIDVTDDVIISDINVTVDVSHTWVSDLIIALNNPDNEQILLWNQYCGNIDAFAVTFDDDGAALGNTCTNPQIGTFAPFGPLSTYTGQQSGGTWTLLAVDFWQQDTGQVNSWTMEICTQQAILKTESISSLSEFKVYPNPNNGSFNVHLNSTSDATITMELFDIRGRKVFNNEYANNGNFDQTINLSNVTAGVYLLNVSDGVSKETKKLVIQ